MTDKIHHAMKVYIAYRTSDPDPIAKKPEDVNQLDAWLTSEVQMSESQLDERFEAEAQVDVTNFSPEVNSYLSIVTLRSRWMSI